MLHYDSQNETNIPYQVEMNMISAGCGSVSTKTNQLHDFLVSRFEYLSELYKGSLLESSNTFENIPLAMKNAHVAHGKGFDLNYFNFYQRFNSFCCSRK
jgi:hypothetical protein